MDREKDDACDTQHAYPRVAKRSCYTMRARDSAQHEQNALNERKCVAVGHMSLVGADDRKMESAVTAATATVAAATQIAATAAAATAATTAMPPCGHMRTT